MRFYFSPFRYVLVHTKNVGIILTQISTLLYFCQNQWSRKVLDVGWPIPYQVVVFEALYEVPLYLKIIQFMQFQTNNINKFGY